MPKDWKSHTAQAPALCEMMCSSLASHSPDKVEQRVDAVDTEALAVRSERDGVPQGCIVGDGPPFLAHEGILDDLSVRQVREDAQQYLVRQLVDGLRRKGED